MTIDANTPVINSATVSGGTAKVGTAITLTVVADAAGYTCSACTLNGVAVTGFSDDGGGTYTMTYTVVEGNTNRNAGATPVSIVLDDGENTNAAHTTLVESSAQTIDANSPAATTSATVAGGVTAKVGDTVTITVVASEGSLLCQTCTMNGGTLTSWTNTAGSTYTGVYTVVEGQTDRAAGASNFISLVLADAAGNTNAAFTTLTESAALVIDANSPAVTSATVTGGTAKIGTVITVTVAADAAGYTLGTSTMNGVNLAGFNDATGGSYTMTYTVASGNTDRGAGATPISIIPVSYTHLTLPTICSV